MANSRETWGKKQNEKNKNKKREDKARRKEERKASAGGGDMIAYVDEYGNLSSTPPDPAKKAAVKAEDIVLGVPKREAGPAISVTRTGTVTMFNGSKGY